MKSESAMGNIPKGYKQTEVGVIPEDWEVVCLGEMTSKIGSGITPTGGERVYRKEGRPFLRSQNVGWGHLLMDDIAFINDTIHETFSATEILDNDVFLNITGASIGRSAVADSRVEGGNVNQHVCIIRTANDKLNPHFLNFILLSKVGQKQIDSFQAGGNRQGLNFGQIRSFKIPLPPTKAEQIAIAAALSDVDALISSLEKLIAKKRNIKQGAMQELLTGKKRLPGFSRKWEVKKLGEIADFSNGKAHENFIVDSGKYIVVNSKFISSEGEIIKYSDNCFCPASIDDILMVMSDIPNGKAIAKCFLVDRNEKYTVNQRICLLHTKGVDSKFLFYKINRNPYYLTFDDGVKQTNLRKEDVLNCELDIPVDKSEQTAIAQILSDIDVEIEQLEQKLAKYRMIKQGMMQELLTGRIRIV